jgi:hypothetical protein
MPSTFATGAPPRLPRWAVIPPAPVAPLARLFAPLLRPSVVFTLIAGVLTPFTVSLGGEMPIGELALFAAAAWALLIVAISHAWPGGLWRDPVFLGLLGCQAFALVAYVASDLYRGSAPHDFIRGWARMIFLGIDLAAVAYLVGCSALNFVVLLVGVQLGEVFKVHLQGALFDDYWKFGYAAPVTVGVLLIAGRLGLFASVCAAAGLGIVHFYFDFRSLGMLCLVVAAFLGVQAFPRLVRAWIAPLGLAGALVLVGIIYSHTRSDREGQRSTRSDVERSSMVIAALEAFRDSPLLGHGSWFSRTDVMDNFMIIREERARMAGVGGFAGSNEEEEGVTLHSQLLVTLAEGGVFGAAFFIPFAFGLVWALYQQVIVRAWTEFSPVRHYVLVLALFHVFLSPFSGAHRVGIALAAALVVLIHRERTEAREESEADSTVSSVPVSTLSAPRFP